MSMRLISERQDRKRELGPWLRYGASSAAVTAAALAGASAVDADSAWYRSLRKPLWQPPSRVFGAVWTPLYATIAYAAGHALGTAQERRQRTRLATSLAVNLTLNAGCNWLFFGLRSPKAGLAGTVLLNLSNAELIHRTDQTDPAAARTLLPYAAWCAFATALSRAIARQNSGPGQPA
ncbi:tryptophan-rich sensory protein [Streptomyces sp. NPDC007905]|uniref:TspO/MBR family protein n=1 Tax=Streptomyces sp. NPDC007905 TaxID=3364788 RepID=UPI0036E95DEB